MMRTFICDNLGWLFCETFFKFNELTCKLGFDDETQEWVGDMMGWLYRSGCWFYDVESRSA